MRCFVTGGDNYLRRLNAPLHPVILTAFGREGSVLRQAGHRGKEYGNDGKEAEHIFPDPYPVG